MNVEPLATQITAIRREISEVGCQVDSTPWGAFVWNADHPLVHDLTNCGWVDRWPSNLSGPALLADFERRRHRARLRHELLLFAEAHLADRAHSLLTDADFAPIHGSNLADLESPRRKPRRAVHIEEVESPQKIEAFWDLAAQELQQAQTLKEESRQQLAVDRQRYQALSARLFLATLSESLAGYAVLLERLGLGYVFQVYTLPPFRREGVGTALILRLVEASREAGHLATALTVNSTNDAAFKMYRQLGFVEVGEKRNFERLGERPDRDLNPSPGLDRPG